jgi:hypothetical protein
MPKPFLHSDDARLERELIETMLAGLKQWRSDLNYPESHSDMQALVRGILCTHEIKRRPLPVPLRYMCNECEGLGHFIEITEGRDYRMIKDCPKCKGNGWIPSD